MYDRGGQPFSVKSAWSLLSLNLKPLGESPKWRFRVHTYLVGTYRMLGHAKRIRFFPCRRDLLRVSLLSKMFRSCLLIPFDLRGNEALNPHPEFVG